MEGKAMTIRRMMCHRAVISFIFCIALVPSLASASQSSSDYRSFVDEIASTVFRFAWPTATYESVSFDGVRETSSGVEISFRLHGRSAFWGHGPLWTDVIIEISGGQITDLRWGENNAILAQPGETMKALGQALEELTRAYQQGQSRSRSERSPSDVLAAQFTKIRDRFAGYGYSETHSVYTNHLNAGDSHNTSFALRSGMTYLISGVCDQDCTDLDILLYDSDGNLIADDQKEDDHPLVSVTPIRTGEFTIKIKMIRCSVAPCYFGTQIFGK
jgi:hypothetical protein